MFLIKLVLNPIDHMRFSTFDMNHNELAWWLKRQTVKLDTITGQKSCMIVIYLGYEVSKCLYTTAIVL